MASSASEIGQETARSGATLSRPRQCTHPSAAGDKLNLDTIGLLVTATRGNNKASQKMVPPEERCPARNDAHHASAHRGWNIKLLLPVFYVLLVTVTGKEKHWLSSSSNDEHVIRIQRGNRGDRASRMVDIGRTPLGRGGSPKNIPPPVDDVIHAYRTQRGKWGASAQSHSRRFLSFKDKYGSVERDRRVTGGDQRKIALNSSPIWDDKALKSVPSGEYRGVIQDNQTTLVKAGTGKIKPTKEVKNNERGGLQKSKSGRPRILFIFTSRNHHNVAPWRRTVSCSQDGHPTSEGGADKPPDPTEKDMRRISEGGEELRIGICGGE